MAKKKSRKHKISKRRDPREGLPFSENVHRAKIKVIGVGGGGGNIVSEISSRVQRFDFVGANTDSQALKELPKKVKGFSFGQDLTGGLGCGMDAELGERCAKAEKDKIRRLLEGSDICILVATLGGGTGSGAVATFAEISQEMRSLTVGIFTMPFAFEGERRKQIAEAALEKVKPFVNSYVIIPNERIFRIIDQKVPLQEALSAVNKKLASTLEGFMDALALPGLINIDFADVRSTLEGKGRLAYINSAEASGTLKAQEVVQGVLVNPLYDYTIEGADRILFNITGDRNLKMQEVAHMSSAISDYNPKARIIFGIACNSRVKDRIKLTLFAVGCSGGAEKPKKDKNRPSKLNLLRRKKLAQVRGQKEEPLHKTRGEKTKEVAVNKENPPAGGQEPPASEGKEKEVKPVEQNSRVRRNALEVKKAVDEELQELEKKEKQWDVPAFLRNK